MSSPEQLFDEHAGWACSVARATTWFIAGSDVEDLEQEALLALLSASRSYRASEGVSFTSYAGMVVRRRLTTAMRQARAQKHEVLTRSMRTLPNEDGEVVAVDERIPDPRTLEQLVEAREQLRAILAARDQLSELEARSLFGSAAGFSYLELSSNGSYRQRDVDNAIQRARVKFRALEQL